MDDKDKIFTISHNGNNEDNSSDAENKADESSKEISDNAVSNNSDEQKRKYDDFMYEPIGFEHAASSTEYTYLESGETEKKKRSNNEKFIIVMLITIFVAIIILAVTCITIDISRSSDIIDNYSHDKVTIYKETKPVSDEDAVLKDENGRYTTEGVASTVRPSIVEIYTYSDEKHQKLSNTGSGIIISEDGYIVTNTHVLSSDGYHVVVTSDDKKYNADIIGRDSKTDIAVIKINANNITAAVLGDSDEIMVGEQVMAIGNPAGLSGTVTDGIVSAVNRKIKGDSTGFEMNCIQTNADISPGNSGGALVNMFGQVIGITSSKYVSSSYEGLGFAITINEALPIIEELIDNGFVSGRFRVGITLIGTDTDASRKKVEEEIGFELPEDFNGIYIAEIAKDSKIAETELKSGDFITEIAGKQVTNYDELYSAVSEFKIGDKIPAKCVRFNDKHEPETFEIEFEIMEDTSGDY